MKLPTKQNNKLSFILIAFISCLLSAPLFAEEVIIPVGQQGSDKASLETPQKGATMDEVSSQFGEPAKRSEAIGTPPISNWEYPHYRVYFESDRVIHTVLKPYAEVESAEAGRSETESPETDSSNTEENTEAENTEADNTETESAPAGDNSTESTESADTTTP